VNVERVALVPLSGARNDFAGAGMDQPANRRLLGLR
jgi:hypothetical protein